MLYSYDYKEFYGVRCESKQLAGICKQRPAGEFIDEFNYDRILKNILI